MRTKDVFMFIVMGFFLWLVFFFGMPILSYGWVGWPITLIIIGILFLVFDVRNEQSEGSWRMYAGIFSLVIGLLFFVILPIGSMHIFNADNYRNLIGEVEQKTYSNDISPIDPTRIVLIDYDVAAKLGDKKLSDVENMALGSQTSVGKYTHQKIGTDLYYAAPLNHSGFLKWRKHKQGTCGYILVNAHNQKDVRLVKDVNGKELHLKYQEGGCFDDYLPRHIYRAYRKYDQGDIEFEIDDDLNPWYVVALYDKVIGYGGKQVVKCLVINPETGKIDEYKPEDVPAWVDRVYPKTLMNKQFDLWGDLVHGWWNFSNQDKVKLSQETQLVYGTDGKCYLFSGVTSVGSDDASVGFIMVDARTKHTIFYHASGAIETAAQASAEGRVQEKEYKSSQPRPYNINGVWTYVMALKDKEGLIKSIAMVSYANYEIVGIGETIQDAIRNYKAALNNKGDIMVASNEHSKSTLVGQLVRVGSDNKDGQTYYYLVFKESANILFVGTSALSNELPLTQIGDEIKITFEAGEEGEVFIETFDNHNLNFVKSTEQVKADSVSATVEKRINSDNLDLRLKSKMETMTPEEKEKLLEK
jgi:hypothetical protein